jgi:hypothetical protein
MFALAGLAACGGVDAPLGLNEPIRVPTGAWKSGPLPGVPPVAGATEPPGSISVTAVDATNGVFYAGASDRLILGRVSPNAVAIAVRFPDLGTGYWVLPVGLPDPTQGNELTWTMPVDLAADVPLGARKLRFVAIDAGGVAGTQRDLSICVGNPIPDNLNACDPSIPPPAAVISLSWANPADLDLHVVVPGGRVVDARHPSTVPPTGARPEETAAPGILDIDAQPQCRPAGRRRENLVWQKPPLSGTYLLYVNLFDACGEPASTFEVTLNTPEPGTGGTSRLVERQRIVGRLPAVAANGGAALGLYVGAVSF